MSDALLSLAVFMGHRHTRNRRTPPHREMDLKMTRTRASAKAAGSSMERMVADYFKEHGFPFADRRVKTGAKDCGDIGGVHAHDQPVAIEVKNYGGRLEPSTWLKEAQVEAANDQAAVGLVVAKRRGTTDPGKQYVLMELADLLFLINGTRP